MDHRSAYSRVSALARDTVQALDRAGKTVTFMESCTGGLLSSLLTDIPGASEVFSFGSVTYSNAAKTASGVEQAVLLQGGVYSAACAGEMARAAQKTAKADLSVGVTGTLGSADPRNADSVPGAVYFCILHGDRAVTEHLSLSPSLSRPAAKLAVAEAVFARLLSLLQQA